MGRSHITIGLPSPMQRGASFNMERIQRATASHSGE
jgi:hypothetical protein